MKTAALILLALIATACTPYDVARRQAARSSREFQKAMADWERGEITTEALRAYGRQYAATTEAYHGIAATVVAQPSAGLEYNAARVAWNTYRLTY